MIDNRRDRLAERVRDLLTEGAVAAHFAVGYLFLDGLTPLQAEFDRLEEVRLLIGNVVNRLTDEQVREEAASRLPTGEGLLGDQEDFASTLRQARTREAAVTGLNLRRTLAQMPRDAARQALLLTLARRIADGSLKVRLYTRGRIHAKLALMDYPDGGRIAVVGSSNLTLGGPAHPTDLNVVVRDPASIADLESWYGELWDGAQDFHRELFEELGLCWAMSPLSALGGALRR